MKAHSKEIPWLVGPLPKDYAEAASWLTELVVASGEGKLLDVSHDLFRRGWFAIGFLYPGLHPDSALDHGSAVSSEIDESLEIEGLDPCLIAPFYVESGWPIVLAAVASEGWRRYEASEMAEEEFYCSEAVIAGMCFRNPALAEEVRRERMTIAGHYL